MLFINLPCYNYHIQYDIVDFDVNEELLSMTFMFFHRLHLF